MKMEKIEHKYSKLLKGKKVAIVGSGWCTKFTKQKDKIESNDLVVRMNLGYRVSSKVSVDIGSRTDILYCTCSEHFLKRKVFSKSHISEFKNNYKIKWIVGTGHHRGNMLKVFKKNKDIGISIRSVSRESFKKVSSQTKKKITTGIITIFDLLQFPISELYVTGFSFFNFMLKDGQKGKKKVYYSQYLPNYQRRVGTVFKHDNKREFVFFKKMCKNDKRIKCDNFLRNLMEKY